uniref:Uncharacterized protein n=1 Tax=Arundo donax TaxID=35708 RepID=A0A0A8ZMS4_ARUDO
MLKKLYKMKLITKNLVNYLYPPPVAKLQVLCSISNFKLTMKY